MTAYFDDLRAEVRELPQEGWLAALGAIEKRVAQEVMLVTGDREFPSDLREKILDTINMKAVYDLSEAVPATKKAVKYAEATRSSGLLEALHSLFHTVASRRVKTRFGFLSDSPRAILKARDSHDSEIRL